MNTERHIYALDVQIPKFPWQGIYQKYDEFLNFILVEKWKDLESGM